jgi:hypothetical protein
MADHDRASTVLDEDNAAFVQSGASIFVASRSKDNAPSIVRGLGCRVSNHRRSVTVLLWAAQADSVLTDVRTTGTIAVVFSRPSTHRTVQLKGCDAMVVLPTDSDRATVARNTASIVDDLSCLGHRPELIRTQLHCEANELAAIAFTPSAAFDQTPGPRAGRPLGS